MNVNWINDLKLRVGAGVTGNSAIAAYATQGAITSLFYPFYTTSTAGAIPTQHWQIRTWDGKKQPNIMSVLISVYSRDRISGSFDVYTSKTTDLLLKRSIPTVTGYTINF